MNIKISVYRIGDGTMQASFVFDSVDRFIQVGAYIRVIPEADKCYIKPAIQKRGAGGYRITERFTCAVVDQRVCMFLGNYVGEFPLHYDFNANVFYIERHEKHEITVDLGRQLGVKREHTTPRADKQETANNTQETARQEAPQEVKVMTKQDEAPQDVKTEINRLLTTWLSAEMAQGDFEKARKLINVAEALKDI